MMSVKKLALSATACLFLASVGGCTTVWRTPATADACSEAYRRGDYQRLVEISRDFERLGDSCRRAVLVALADEAPGRLLEVATESGQAELVIAAALAAGTSGAELDVPFRTRRVMKRSADGRFVLAWLRTGRLETIEPATTLGKELGNVRGQVAGLLHRGADDAALRPAVRMLAVLTETAMQDGGTFTSTLPGVPVRPKTVTLRGLALKLALAPYLTDTPVPAALSIVEMEAAPAADDDSSRLGARTEPPTEG